MQGNFQPCSLTVSFLRAEVLKSVEILGKGNEERRTDSLSIKKMNKELVTKRPHRIPASRGWVNKGNLVGSLTRMIYNFATDLEKIFITSGRKEENELKTDSELLVRE